MYGPDTTVDTGFWTASQKYASDESASYQELPTKRRKDVEKLDLLARRRNSLGYVFDEHPAGDVLQPPHLGRT